VAASSDLRTYRLTSIDMLRGLVIVIMAIDHVRDAFLTGTTQDPTTDPNVSPSLFFTRWITHYCAPVFVTLAGTSAGLMTSRKSPAALSTFLVTRGIWLVFVEMAIVSTATTLSPGGIPELDGRVLIIMQVIWAIGASMIVLAGLQWLGRRACLALGIAILVGHNLLDGVWPATQMLAPAPLWTALHSQSAQTPGPFMVLMVYPLLPWIGVMLFGFGIAPLFERTPERRDRLLLRAGIIMIAAFVVLRTVALYGDPNPWQTQPAGPVATIIDLLNTTKYPPSLLFLLMTLGPAAILCSIADRMRGPIKDALVMFGRVPFAFYVAHVYLIHLMSIALGAAQGFSPGQFLTPFIFYPKGYGVGLLGMYVAWAILIALLYPCCRWVAGIKARRKDWWLSYL
jgi:uncharacterized membrane protein